MDEGSDSGRVRFGRPDVGKIRERGLACADMHFHTHYSDSYTRVTDAMVLAKKRDVGFAITDHNLIAGSLEAHELNKDFGLLLVPGIEISSWDGPHILVYFYTLDEMVEYWTRNVKPYISASPWLAIDKGTEWILDSLEDVNCVISAAHPLGYLSTVKGVQKAIDNGILDRSVAQRMDAYEVICSGMFRSENEKAWKYAEEYGIGFTGGSDGHLLSELGSVLTVSDAKDVDEFLDNIVRKRNAIVGKEKNIPLKMVMAMASVSRFLGAYPVSSMARKAQINTNKGTKNCPDH
jgi:predicted metal-dependent phosphoesterase TrpH